VCNRRNLNGILGYLYEYGFEQLFFSRFSFY
jgi:hypothetical protein